VPGPITLLWLVDEPDMSAVQDERFQHAFANPDRPAAAITGLLSSGAVLAVVRNEDEGQRALAYGADEVVLGSEVSSAVFQKIVERTIARARARLHRDLFLIDLVRKDDTSALALLATALGQRIVEPLARVSERSAELAEEITGGASPAGRAQEIAATVTEVSRVVEKMRSLVSAEPTDELVDLCEVAREAVQSLAPGVAPVTALEVRIVDRVCQVGLPRWQATMMVASLVANAVESVAARPRAERSVAIDISVQEGAVVLEVADNGLGMAEDVRVHAGDPFFTTAGSGRLGLGLPLVSARVRRAGGELIIDSDQGVGTCVRVFLPLVGDPPPRGKPS
jgi:signal transduction histidine kinase